MGSDSSNPLTPELQDEIDRLNFWCVSVVPDVANIETDFQTDVNLIRLLQALVPDSVPKVAKESYDLTAKPTMKEVMKVRKIALDYAKDLGEGDTSREDKPRLDRPLAILGAVLSKALLKYPFASANTVAKHFDISGPTVKDLFIRELGRWKFTGKWVSIRYRRRINENEQPNQNCDWTYSSTSRS